MKKNVWINVEDYKPFIKHELLCDSGNTYTLAEVRYYRKRLHKYFEIMDVKRVMILSRK